LAGVPQPRLGAGPRRRPPPPPGGRPQLPLPHRPEAARVRVLRRREVAGQDRARVQPGTWSRAWSCSRGRDRPARVARSPDPTHSTHLDGVVYLPATVTDSAGDTWTGLFASPVKMTVLVPGAALAAATSWIFTSA